MGCGARVGAGASFASVFLAVISAASAGREATEEDFASSTEKEGSSRHLILLAGPDFAGCTGTGGSILLSFLSFSIPLAAVDSWAPLILALELVTYPELSEFSDLVGTAAGAGLGLGPKTPWCHLILYF